MEQFLSPRVQEVTLDPVCGTTLDVSDSFGPVVFKGAVYHFCSARCQSQFFARMTRRPEPRLAVSFLSPAVAVS